MVLVVVVVLVLIPQAEVLAEAAARYQHGQLKALFMAPAQAVVVAVVFQLQALLTLAVTEVYTAAGEGKVVEELAQLITALAAQAVKVFLFLLSLLLFPLLPL
jgi:hypothetical protein